MPRRRLFLITLAAAFLAAGSRSPVIASPQVGGEFADLEQLVSQHPGDVEARSRLAAAYAQRGFIEEAVGQYLAVLARQPGDEQVRTRVTELVAQRMPAWLPNDAVRAAPFPHRVLALELADLEGRNPPAATLRSGETSLHPRIPPTRQRVPPTLLGECAPRSTSTYRLLLTTAAFAAREGERADPVHRWLFPQTDCGYVWNDKTSSFVMRIRAHRGEGVDAALADQALAAVLCFHCAAREYAERDPTRPGGQPIELWLTRDGQPGAHSVGRNLYLYAMGVQRKPAEWLREIAHEYGHMSLPGLDGFVDSDDPWADGDLAELLFVKWLAAGGAAAAGSLPWSLKDAEDAARKRREQLVSLAGGGVDRARLAGAGADARDYFLGLALRAEEAAGPRFLAEALARCPRAKAVDFVAAAEALAKERGVQLWQEPGAKAASANRR